MSEVARLTPQQIDKRIANIASFAAVNHRGYENAAIAHVKFLLEVLAAPPAVWSREKPTVEGWYWWRFIMPNGKWCRRIVEIGPSSGEELLVYQYGRLSNTKGEWSGPLRPPVEGKG